VDSENVEVILRIGRSRWKIENEQFNIQKNHGYELEHNYGHGKNNLSMVFLPLEPAGLCHALDPGIWGSPLSEML
jgi:hypothetical protein